MTIVDAVQVHAVSVPRKLFRNARGNTTSIEAVIICIRARDGAYGLSETDIRFPISDISVEALAAMVGKRIAPVLVGQDARNINRLMAAVDQAGFTHIRARAGVEVALIDLVARSQDVPAGHLLGGLHAQKLPLVAPLGIGDPEELAQQAAGFVQQGFAGVKVKIGREPHLDVDRIRAVRAAIGSAVILRADANAAYTYDEALRVLRKVEDCELQCIEQPLPGRDLEGMSRLANAVATPLMADESLKEASAIELIRRNAAAMFHVKVQSCGGLFKAREILSIAAAAGVRCIVGQISSMSIASVVDATLALSVADPLPGEMVGPLIIEDDVVTAKVDLSAGHLDLGGRVGLGFELDAGALDKYGVGKKAA